MDASFLVRVFGFPATLIHGDFLVLDRWIWVRNRLPQTRDEQRLLDVGCGTGAFTIGAALRGYTAVGLSWDVRNQTVATERAAISGAEGASFPIQDARDLHLRDELKGGFHFILCLENIEHILDDRKLMQDMFDCLAPGGFLLLSAPNFYYRAISQGDLGPFLQEETGWHVRRGYTSAMLRELCAETGFAVQEIGSCSGFSSQKFTKLWRSLAQIRPALRFAFTLPLRAFPPLIDPIIRRIFKWPDYSICLVAYKPRFVPQTAGPAPALAQREIEQPASVSRM